MSMNGFVKCEQLLDDDIKIEHKPPFTSTTIDRITASTGKVTIVTENECNENICMKIEIDDIPRDMVCIRPCYVVLNRLSDITHQRKTSKSGKPFSCEFCPKSFALKSYLNTHRLMHTKEKTIQCNKCPKKFISQNYLNKHFRATHVKPFACNECSKKFRLECTLKRHKGAHRMYTCYLCSDNRIFLKIGILLDHMRSRHSSERPFACDQCPKTFAVKSYLTAHKQSHTLRERVHECERCEKNFFNRSILRQHMISHQDDKPFKCEKCPKSFSHKSDLSRHVQTNSCKRITYLPKGSILQCYICQKERKTVFMLQKHMLLAHLRNHAKRYGCDECPKKYTSNDHLITHKNSAHRNKRPFVCTLCSKRFNNKAYLAKHCLVHSKETPFECQTCSKAFSNLSNLKRHQVSHVGERKYECAVCSKKFMHKSILKLHTFTHVSGLEFPCTECSKTYLSTSALKRHIKLTHLESNVKRFKCDLCDKSFKEKTILKGHIRVVHLQERPFECSQCQKKFPNKSKCIIHEHACKGPKPFGCKFCSKKFASKDHLLDHNKFHILVSETKKYFECYFCKYTCEWRGGLFTHMLKHNKKRPFSCDLCSKKCPTISSLKRHKVSHSNERPFACDRCPKAFKTSKSLREHKYTHDTGMQSNKKIWVKVPVNV